MAVVEGIVNPGDSASRPMTAEALLSRNQWLMGPEFLWQPWPQNPSLGSILCDKADIKVSMASITKSVHPLTEYFHRVSSWQD